MAIEFEWNAKKAKSNLKKHGVSFDDAATVFRDALSITISDPDHSESENHSIDVGMSYRMELLVVSYTERKNRIRIISARRATRAERKAYEEGN